jgi:hypothetical protein
MSLNGTNSDGVGLTWDMEHITSIHPGARDCFHIVNGSDGTGDIYNWNNITFLHDAITKSLLTTNRDSECRHPDPLISECGHVDLFVADGGFESQRDSECQEDITSKLVLNQVLAGLYMLRPGGNLCVKMFGFQCSMSRIVLLMLHQSFDFITMLKPITSRPASAERYVVGRCCKPGVAASVELLRNVALSSSLGDPTVNLTHLFLSFEYDLLLLNGKACNHILSVLRDYAMEEEQARYRSCTSNGILSSMTKKYIKYWKL